MSLCVIVLTLTSAFCVVTSQEHGEAEGIVHNIMSGGDIPSSSSLLNAIGMADGGAGGGGTTHTGLDPGFPPDPGMANRPLRGEPDIERPDPKAGPMKKFTLQKVNSMINGMNNGFRYKYDGAPSTHEDDIVISMEQLIAMKAQLEGTGSGTSKKQFSIDEVRMMLDGMHNGMRYNIEGQVSTVVTEEVLTIIELETLMTELQTQEQAMQRFPLHELRRMAQGMEPGGLKYNYQGQIAQEGQPTFSLPQLKKYLKGREAQGTIATDLPIMPEIGPNPDAGLKSIGRFTLDQIRTMIADTERGIRYNYRGEPATSGQVTLTMEQLQRFLNELLSQGIIPTAVFNKLDLDRMLKGVKNGLKYNYQGQIATPGQAVLTEPRINELRAKLDAKGPMDVGIQTPNFSVDDLRGMLNGMDNGSVYNHQGLEAGPNEPTLSYGYLTTLLNQLDPHKVNPLSSTGIMQTVNFTRPVLDRMLQGIKNGLEYNYQGQIATPGQAVLTEPRINELRAKLDAKGPMDTLLNQLDPHGGMGGQMQTPSFNLDDIFNMLAGMDSGFKYNYRGKEAKEGEPVLTRNILESFMTKLKDTVGSMCRHNGVIYKHGENFKDACNTCTCSNGTAACTLMACPGHSCTYYGVTYNHGESFKDSCNTCKCTDGHVACTKMACPSHSCTYNGVTYNHGESFKDACNTCKCSDGYAVCTKMACPGNSCRQNGVTYKHGESFKDACNTCTCSNGNVRCTLMACPGHPCLHKGVTYKHGVSFKDACNTCKCSDGKAGCTRMACPNHSCTYNGVTYNHGESFKDSCNTCKCTDGHAACTKMACLDDFCIHNGMTYKHGDSFKDACNTCTCTNGAVGCTLMGCIGYPCLHEGVNYDNGESFKDACNTCKCTDGYASCTKMACPRSPCTHKGVTYNHGATFKDACNTCTCSDGKAGCTRMACPGYPCFYKGANYDHGASFKDACNTCTCSNSYAGCTRMDCLGYTCLHKGANYNHGESFKDACNTCKCTDGYAVCTKMACPGSSCIHKGVTYKHGDRFKEACNTCNCNDGYTACTLMACYTETRPTQSVDFTIPDLERMIAGMKQGEKFNYEGLPAAQGETPLAMYQVTDLLNRLQNASSIEVTSTITIEQSVITEGTNETITQMINGTDGSFESSFSSESSHSSSFSENTVSFGTSGGEGSNVVDINLMAKGDKGDKVFKAPNETAGFTGETKEAASTEAGKGLRNATLSNVTHIPQIGDKSQNNNISSKSVSSSIKEPKENITSQNTKNITEQSTISKSKNNTLEKVGKKSVDLLSNIGNVKIGDLADQIGTVNITVMGNPDGEKDNSSIGSETVSTKSQVSSTDTTEETKKNITVTDTTSTNVTISRPADNFASFTKNDITRLREGIHKGESYNYRGLPSAPGDTILSIEDLDRILTDIDTRGTHGVQTSTFTREDINRMIDGINRGESYNLRGLPASQSDKLLTIADLNKLKQDLDNIGMGGKPNRTGQFTVPDLERMITGMKTGEKFNFQGLPAAVGDPVLSLTDLNELLRTLQKASGTGMGGKPNRTGQFTVPDLERMITGMKTGEQFNFQGLPAAVGDPVLSLTDLNELLRTLQKASGTDPLLDIPSSRFTRDHINRMIDGVNRGESYNYQGLPRTGNEKAFTIDELNSLLTRFDTRDPVLDIPSSRFTRDDINRMIDGFNRGESYNYQGLPRTGNEKAFTIDDLNRLRARLDTRDPVLDIPSSRFTRDDINRMIDGFNRGESYNYQGLPRTGNEKAFTIDDLNRLRARFDTIDPVLDIPSSRFTRDDINRMIDGFNRGESYNYQGLPRTGNEKAFTIDDLNRLRARFDTIDPVLDIPSSRFTRDDINRMIDGFNRGESYNYQGLPRTGNEKAFTIDDLNRLRARFDTIDPVLDIPSSRFTRDDINRMIDGFNRGESYNYQGLPRTGNEKAFTIDDLNSLRARFDTIDPVLDIPSSRFTRDDINRMIDGFNRGESYNYQGLPRTGNEKAFTIDDLNRLRARFDTRDPVLDIPSSRFTRDDINRMIDGFNRGESYNYQGLPRTGNEKAFTIDDLNRLRARFDTIDPVLDIPSSRFTRDDINRMIDGFNRGESYNYQGLPRTGNEKAFTIDDLNRLRARFDTIDPVLDIPSSRFTRDDINRMIDGFNRGESYNYQGLPRTGNEKAFTIDDLNRLRARFDTIDPVLDIPSSRFTRDDINRMIDGFNRGESYNYQGLPRTGNEKAFTIDDLNRLRARFDTIDPVLDIPSSRFTRDDINRMIDGFNRGESYNYQGLPRTGNEKAFTIDDLNRLRARFDTIDPVLDIPSSRFTRDDINRMIDGFNRGESYNYQGLPRTGNEKAFTIDDLNRLRARFDTIDPVLDIPSSRFTRDDINRMIDGFNRGESYNYQGLPRTGNEKAFTIDDLNRLRARFDTRDPVLDIPSSRFTRDDINRMIDGFNRGESYNYQGLPRTGNEKAFTIDDLNRLRARFDTIDPVLDIPSSRFTRDDINRMIDGFNRGESYNYQGLPRTGNEKAFTIDDLNRLRARFDTIDPVLDIPSSRFTRDDINRMIDGFNRGESYNYHGLPRTGNEKAFTIDDLNRLRARFDTIDPVLDIPSSRFTRDDINRMIDGFNRGESYNYQGLPRTGNEKAFTIDDLNRLRARFDTIDPVLDIPSSRFTRDDINRMIDGFNRGESYNYQGLPRTGNEKAFTIDDLNRLRARFDTIDPVLDIPSSRFTRDDINRMIDGFNRGESYNYQGLPRTGNEKAFTIDDLNRLRARFDTIDPVLDIPSSRFTRDDINRMIDGFNRGESYNYQGLPRTGNEKAFTIDDLNRLRARFDTRDPVLDIPSSRFTIDDINRMIDGFNRGESYNYHGLPRTGNEKAFTIDDLNRLRARFDTRDPVLDIPSSRFTRDDINRMIDGFNRGESYNYHGLPRTGNEKAFTIDDLNRLRARFDTRDPVLDIPSSRFTRDDINRMIDGFNRGESYNYHGLPRTGNEKAFTIDDLNRLRARFDTRDPVLDIPSSRFTIDDINRMIDGFNRGESYNYHGLPRTGNEKAFTIDDLNRLRARFDTRDPVLDIPSSRFTRDDINRMIDGFNRGESYNYHGLPRTGNEKAFTIDDLNRLRARFDTRDPVLDIPSSRFTRDDINRMIDGFNRSESYNYHGLPRTGNEKAFTIDDLNRLRARFDTTDPVLDIPSSRFTRDDINRMIDGFNRGESYNYQGLPHTGNEKAFTIDDLNRLRARFDTRDPHVGVPGLRFSRDDINQMIEGIRSGTSYNHQGLPPSSGEKALTMEDLNRYLKDLNVDLQLVGAEAVKFTLDDLKRMLAGMDKGLKYNYHGQKASIGESTLTKKQLNTFYVTLAGGQNTIVITNFTADMNNVTLDLTKYTLDQTNFTLEGVKRMLTGMDQGHKYNFKGKVATAGEPTINRRQLNRLLSLLESASNTTFTLNEIERMLNGIDKGLVYNYKGNEAVPGEKPLTRDDLIVYLLDLLAQQFNRNDIDGLLAGLDRGENYNYQGKPAVGGERTLSRKLLNQLLTRSTTKITTTVTTRNFTIDEVYTMLDNTNRGSKYNYQGKEAQPGEKSLTSDDLIRFLADMLPVRFNPDDIRRLLAGLDRGDTYNFNGEPAKLGEPVLRREVLDRLLLNKDRKPSVPRPNFTLNEIQRMLDGMKNGLSYNYQGNESQPGDKTFTDADLTGFYLDLLASRFNRDDINRLLAGIDRGEAYNIEGNLAKAGEPLLERALLNRALPIIDKKTTPSVPRPNFTLNEIQRMLDGMKNGLSYNYQGNESQPGDKTFTDADLTGFYLDLLASRFNRDDINRLLAGIDRGEAYNIEGNLAKAGEPLLERELLNRVLPIIEKGTKPSVTRRNFTLNDIGRMLDGIGNGLTYNYDGNEAKPGDKTFTRDELTVFLLDLLGKRFNLDDINRLLSGLDRGEAYNYEGNPAKTGEPLLDRGLLNRLLPIVRKDTKPSVTRRNFTVNDIGRMLDGIGNGLTYNYDGNEAKPGDKTFTRDELTVFLLDLLGKRFNLDDINRLLSGLDRNEAYNYEGNPAKTGEPLLDRGLLNRLLPIVRKDTKPSVTRRNFTVNDIGRMLDGIGNGLTYNYDGNDAKPGDKTFTREELTVFLLDLLGKRFNLDDINRLLSGLDRGEAYNYEGNPAKTGEPLLDRGLLNRLLPIVRKDTKPSVTRRNFTLNDIGRMLDGIGNGLTYNYEGNEAKPGDKTFTRDELTVFLLDLLGKRFNLDDINRLLAGLDRGEAYNYEGNPAKTGEPLLDRGLLNRLLPIIRKDTKPSVTRRNFTVNDIGRMLDGVGNGLTYNYDGNEAKPEDKTFTREELTVFLLDLLGKRFNLDDINRLLSGLDRNEAYNYEGNPAKTGEPLLDRGLLNRLLPIVRKDTKPSVTRRNFTLNDIGRMLDGIGNGLTYNYDGNEAKPGDKTFTRDELTVFLLDLLGKRFNLDDINRLLSGLDRGEAYNYEGNPAKTGEPLLDRGLLNRLLPIIRKDTKPSVTRRNFTVNDIGRMLDGVGNGLTYNYDGNEAKPGDKTFTREELTVFLLDLLGKRFNLDDINRLLSGLDRNEAYNYEGNPAKTGEPLLDRGLLNRLLPIVRKDTTPSVTRRNFTLNDIGRMLDGIGNGLTYNYDGNEAKPGDKTFTRDELTVFLLDLLGKRLNLDDINRLLSGLDRGEAYNYEGNPAKTGEPLLDRGMLNRLLPIIRKDTTPGVTKRNFTIDDTLRMLDGLEKGLTYNNQGNEATAGDPTLSRDDLRVLLFDQLASSYNLDDVNRMLGEMDNGTLYTYMGQLAKTGERTWPRDMLEDLLIYLLNLRYNNVAALKPANISSMYNTQWTADKGVDENRDGNMFGGSCFHTKDELNPYFIVDLGRDYNLNSLVMFNRDDCCGERAKNLVVSTGYSKDNMTPENAITGPIGRRYVVRFTPDTNARYVKIESKHDTPLPMHLCEVELYGSPVDRAETNLALNKPATISSEFNSRWTADKGVDGNTSQNIYDDSCFHTGTDIEPYFIVNLGAVYDLNKVTLYNRQDCCDDRARNIEISTSLTPEPENFIRREFINGPLPSMTNVSITGPAEGQYVKIQIKSLDPAYLHLCEVEVYGNFVRNDSCSNTLLACQNGGYCTNLGGVDNCICTGDWTGQYCSEKAYTNIALNKPATISSVHNNKWTAEKGVDGNRSQHINDDSCFHTGNDIEPYFIVNLGAVYDINNVTLYNRQDCCDDRARNIEISTSLTSDFDNFIPRELINGPLLSVTNVPIASPAEAQYVKIQIKGPDPVYLHLCEIEVYGNFIKDDSCSGLSPSCQNGGFCTNLGGVHNCICTGNWTGPNCTEIARPNIAFRKNTEISSFYNDRWTSDKAVDGNKNPNMYHDSCFHTLEENNPFWRVDLGAVYDVDQIEIYNRGDCCGDRLKNLTISTGLTKDDLVDQQYIDGPLQDKTTVSLLPPARAQFIQLQNRDNVPAYLHVCEVVVNGQYVRDDLCAISPCLNGGTCTNKIGSHLCICAPGWIGSHCHISTDNIAYNKPTVMSSLYQNDIKYGGDKGVDGDPNSDMAQGSCFHTEKESQPNWMVDLGAVYDLDRIVLHNRKDAGMERARDIEILAGLTKEDLYPIYFHAGEMGPNRSIPITSGTEGQYVMVHIKDLRPEFLHLCEIEIYGSFLRKDLCKNNPCRNGGTCTNKPGMAICNCAPGYGGILCGRDESQVRPTPPPGVTDVPDPDWNGSRIDPAICRRSRCNLPICYLPYEIDCGKYVVCQRTAIGTYVAWKMRCAFGSYWGTGRSWTCERVEDLARQGYVCPTDPCANSSLHTYPDEDHSNCRTFWQCHNGISKPACCPPGQAFNRNTLQCESDPHEFCRSPCPLKIDGCIDPLARTEPFYDGNCRTYWDCKKGHPHPVCCEPGTSYDFAKGYCREDITCTDRCPSDYTSKKCGTMIGSEPVRSYALADGNCRTYMKCGAEGYDDPYCCRQDYFYNPASDQCERLEDVNDVCRYERCPRGYKEECRFKAIPNKPKFFLDSDANIPRKCAPATRFDADICTCVGNSLTNVCKAEVWAKFDQLQDRWSVKNYGDGWISSFGDMLKNRTAQGITYGTFDGSSGMEVWRYDHTALPETTLEITFQPVASGIDRQILVSNCKSVDNGNASFEVSLDPKTSRIIFKGKSKFDAAELSLPYNRQGWNTFKLFFDGKHLVGVIEDPSGLNKTKIQGANLRGEITAGVGALKFGPCLDSFSQPMNNGFTGFVSEVIFSKCIDRRGKRFIRKHLVPGHKKHRSKGYGRN